MSAREKSFPLAPMSPLILWVTVAMLCLPIPFFLAGALAGWRILLVPAGLLGAIYLWIWTGFRPGRFVVHAEALEVRWPLKRRRIPCREIVSVELIDADALKQRVGWGVRVGAGGLWGGFGWLWTQHRGIVQMYVSRTDEFVWIERKGGRPWLITPENPEDFIDALGRCFMQH